MVVVINNSTCLMLFSSLLTSLLSLIISKYLRLVELIFLSEILSRIRVRNSYLSKVDEGEGDGEGEGECEGERMRVRGDSNSRLLSVTI